MHDRIRIVSVAFNSAQVIGDFLASVPKGIEVVVVDNNSEDASRDIAAAMGAKVIALPENRGFGTACNRGAEGNDKEFVFFCNPDSTLTPDCCRLLVEAAEKHPKAGAMNPAILNRRGALRLDRRSALISPSEYTDRRYAEAGNKDSVEVNILTGAALFCRQQAFDEVGGFDEKIFLYHEDDDLVFRMRQAGWTLRIEHGATVSHLGGKSSGSSIKGAALKAYFIAQSRMYVERRHGISAPGLRAVLRALAKITSPLNLLSARKRAQALAYLKGTLRFDMMRYQNGDYMP
ncbi:glycosyltransferase family 2 protein [Roseobacter sp. YSTF-M11]|uniref:Glycosyltransferase family 2 protein n=1 Tax=Roseobacter insulae TaxID=2859783 RepID=A0A9X1FSU8_9RHOB|nr:glycosyltransferase family 2 protein [Roseobacter insulae]MBW4706268.1 glycosyltransferase family 2 protein [Roseobacter insulae]